MRLNIQSIITAVVLAVLASACSSKPFLKVHYQLPSAANVIEEKKVFLTVADVRKNDIFLSQNAKKSLKDFKGTFSLVVLNPDGSGNLVGAYKLNGLLTEIFKRRLEHIGLQVTPTLDNTDPTLQVELKEFNLDFVRRKWIVRMNYQANLTRNGQLLAKESVEGTAERLKVIGKGDAEKIIGELVSDMVNKLDLSKLLQQAYR
ncbi:MAG: hypothetical protein HKO68_20765 [Desulfobacterales bacterium]|nr:hypothetical protein [Desulfobacterales bacterium]